MPTIKIIDDNSKTTTSLFISYSLEPLEEELLLEITLPNSSIEYLIHSDMRERNIRNIEQFIIEKYIFFHFGKGKQLAHRSRIVENDHITVRLFPASFLT